MDIKQAKAFYSNKEVPYTWNAKNKQFCSVYCDKQV